MVVFLQGLLSRVEYLLHVDLNSRWTGFERPPTTHSVLLIAPLLSLNQLTFPALLPSQSAFVVPFLYPQCLSFFFQFFKMVHRTNTEPDSHHILLYSCHHWCNTAQCTQLMNIQGYLTENDMCHRRSTKKKHLSLFVKSCRPWMFVSVSETSSSSYKVLGVFSDSAVICWSVLQLDDCLFYVFFFY